MTVARDDCFATSDALMPLAEALERLRARVTPIEETETVALRSALGRVLAEPVVAPRDVPPHDNSAVDGYAVFHADLKSDGPTRLAVTGRIAAGHPLDRPARPGEALRIFTGAPMPDGADTVIMQEDTETDGDDVIIRPGVKAGANRRRRAEDVAEGDVILTPGTRLGPAELGLAASVGRDRLSVKRRLRAAVFSTGDEVCDPGQTARPGCIYDANRFTVSALLEGLGCDVTDLGILPDRLDAIRDALDAAADQHDLMVTSGGVSIGDEDHVKAAVEALGALHFWKLAIKPGRPIALGHVRGAAFVGLPGNPVAAVVTFLRIGRPLVLRLAGLNEVEPRAFQVPAGFDFKKKPGRIEWLRARLVADANGVMTVEKYRSEGSGILTSLVFADGLIELPEDCAGVAQGDAVRFLPFSEVMR